MDQAKGQAAHAEAALANAKADEARGAQLLAAHAISQQAYDALLAADRQAAADLVAAQASVRSNALNLDFTRVTAPLSGRVSDRRRGGPRAYRRTRAGRGSVDAVAERLKAPKGSFYYRFASRDALLGELWLTTVLAYQDGFVDAIEAGDGLRAALHTPVWARRHLDDARLLMLYSRHDFVHGDWPAPLKRGVADQAERFETCLRMFARSAFGRAGSVGASPRRFRARGGSARGREAPPSAPRAAAAAGR